MKRSGFQQKSLAEIKEKQEAKRLKFNSEPAKQARQQKQQKKRLETILRASEAKVVGGTTKRKRKKKTGVQKMRKACDDLLTPIIKKMYPYCLLTGEPTEVAHHAIKKSTSSALRYYLPNLIPLTHKSHMRLHSDEILWTGRLIALKGLDWWNDLEEKKNVYTKCDVHFYIEQHKRLTSILNGV